MVPVLDCCRVDFPVPVGLRQSWCEQRCRRCGPGCGLGWDDGGLSNQTVKIGLW